MLYQVQYNKVFITIIKCIDSDIYLHLILMIHRHHQYSKYIKIEVVDFIIISISVISKDKSIFF